MSRVLVFSAALCLFGGPLTANAVIIGGIEFPQGAASFADAVVSYEVGTGGVTAPHADPSNALGVPDYAGDNNCTGDPGCSFVSLGSGGTLILRFIDNVLTGSGDDSDDLWIFEVGPDVEDTFIAVSSDGINWNEVGKVFGSRSGVDIDAFGFGTDAEFAYVRLIDDPNEGGQSGITVGADIDAVGAISTRIIPTPEPGALVLLGLGLAGIGLARRRAGRSRRPLGRPGA